MDLTRQRQLELEAEAELELEAEAGGHSRPFAHPPEQLGPDYKQSFGANALRGISQAPEAAWQMGGDLVNFLNVPSETGGPIDVMRHAGPEKTAHTVGGLAAGTAGAAALAPFGASWGSFGGPLGTIVGGVGAGGVGFGLGMLGFDVASDAASQAVTGDSYIRPVDEYAKDFAYNAPQAALLGGGMEGAKIPFKGADGVAASFSKAGAERRVGAKLNEQVPGGAGAVDQALVDSSSIPPELQSHMSLGEILDSPVLKSEQRAFARSGPESYGKSAEAYRSRNDAQLKYLDQIEQSAMTPEDVQASIRKNIEAEIAAKESPVANAQMGVDTALQDLPLPIDKIEAGSTIRGAAEANKTAARGDITASFEGAGNGVVDQTGARAVAAELMPKYFREVGPQPNGELAALVQDLSREGEASGVLDASGNPVVKPAVYTLKDIQAMRSRALDIANGDPRAAGVAGPIAEALKVAGDKAVEAGTVTAEEAASWREGIAKRKQMGVDYESVATPTKSVLSKQPYGEFKVPESAVPSKFFRPGDKGTKEAIRNYKRTVGEAEASLEPLYRYATDSFRDYVVKDGKVDAGKARKWLERHASALSEMPELKRQLSKVDEAQRFLNEKYGDLQRTQAETEKGALKQFLQVDPEKAIAVMLSGRDMVKRTISTVSYLKGKDVDAVAGLRRGVIEHLKQKTFIPDAKVSLEEASLPGGKTFDGTVRGGVFKSEWEKIRPALERSKLFTESQMQGFDFFYKDKSSQLSIEKAKMPGGSDTAQNLSTLAAITRAAGGGFLRNLPFGRYISLLEPVLRAIPQAKFQAAMEEALLNPRYARDLMAKATAKNFTKSAQTIFKDEFAKAFGDKTPGGALVTGAKIAAPMAPVATKDRKPTVPKQQKVIAQKSFPKPEELLRPATPGNLKKNSPYMNAVMAKTTIGN